MDDRDAFSARRPQELTSVRLEALLQRLSPDRDRAGQEYERLRHRLVRYYVCHASASPEVDADAVLDRLARKIAEGVEIRDVERFCFGLARNILKEAQRREARHHEACKGFAAAAEHAPPQDEQRAACWERCLAGLDSHKRELLDRYHSAAGAGRRKWREDLADELGISLNALRIRVFRIREELQACSRECLGRAAGPKRMRGDGHNE